MIFACSSHPDEVKSPLLAASTEVLFEAGTGRGRISWESSFSCRVPGFQDEGHPPWGWGCMDRHLPAAPPYPQLGRAHRCSATTRSRRWRHSNPAGSARTRGTQGGSRDPDVRPTPLLSACRARREAEPRPARRAACGTHESQRPTHRPAGRRATNRRTRVIPRPPGRPAAGAEAATAGVAAEAAAGAGLVSAAPRAGPGWQLLAPGGEGGLPGWAEWPPPRAVVVAAEPRMLRRQRGGSSLTPDVGHLSEVDCPWPECFLKIIWSKISVY